MILAIAHCAAAGTGKYAFVTLHYEDTPADAEYILGVRVLLKSVQGCAGLPVVAHLIITALPTRSSSWPRTMSRSSLASCSLERAPPSFRSVVVKRKYSSPLNGSPMTMIPLVLTHPVGGKH